MDTLVLERGEAVCQMDMREMTDGGATEQLWKCDTACNNGNSKQLGLTREQGVSGKVGAGDQRPAGLPMRATTKPSGSSSTVTPFNGITSDTLLIKPPAWTREPLGCFSQSAHLDSTIKAL